jgi:hypothetical protein
MKALCLWGLVTAGSIVGMFFVFGVLGPLAVLGE